MLLLYIFLLVLMFSSVPYLVLLAKRGRTAANIREQLDRIGAKFYARGIWYMGGIDGKRADFCVVYGGRVISVKVIGFLSAGTAVHFESDTSYLIKKMKPSESNPPLSAYKRHSKRQYDFSSVIPAEFSSLPKAKVILVMDPYPEKLTRSTTSGEKKLRSGDNTGEGELYDAPAFIKLFN